MKQLANIIDTIRNSTCSDIEAQGISLLLHVMSHDPNPLTVKELQDLVGVSHGSIIRYLRLLGNNDDHPRGGECFGLIQSQYCTEDRRRKLVNLTSKGRRLERKLYNE